MPTLYLIQQNTILRKRGYRLLLCKRPPASRRYSAVLQSDIILDLPSADVDHVMLFGNIQVTTSALQLMLGKGIELAIFSYGGQLLGQLTPPMGKNIPLRISQFQIYQNQKFILEFSKKIVSAKINNALTLLRGFHKNHAEAFSLRELRLLNDMITRIDPVKDLKTLRGIEGAAGAHYFKFFGKMIYPPWYFNGRNKRPPMDPVNAVLSFGYVVVGSQIQSLLDGIGLDPYLGFYHVVDYGRPGLALDLLEEFRHPLVDRLTVMLFNKNIMNEADFFKHPSGGMYLNTSGKKKFFLHYEKLLGEILPEENLPAKTGYFPTFQEQIRRLIKSIQREDCYEPFILR